MQAQVSKFAILVRQAPDKEPINFIKEDVFSERHRVQARGLTMVVTIEQNETT